MTELAYSIISITLAVVTFGIILYVGLTTGIIRESVPNFQLKDRMFSLGRFQFWIWTLIICPVFILFWGFSKDHGIDLNTTAVILLGLPAGVALVSNVVGSSQSADLTEEEHIKAEAHAQNPKANAEAHAAKVKIAADPTKTSALEAVPAVPVEPAPKVLKMHQKSKSLFIDLISDSNGQISLGRLQQLIFTVAFIAIYLSSFFGEKLGVLPIFEPEVFTLMGISSGTYLVSKGMGS
ncbi:MAG: hypothetical protein HRT58_19045 [Crocinitomicaceae bacterium]|nr:hypothetical protein [Flavobacteriales bacterium]NQZ37768.1 hypothetical protein [Crocinitomicaceae bacterium]